jgi:hypothetical protein
MNMIELSTEQFDALVSSAKRPSPYETDVRAAVFGKGYAVVISDSPSTKTIVAWLHKAAKAVNVKLQVNVRENAVTPSTPSGLVVWTLAENPSGGSGEEEEEPEDEV